VTGCGLKGVDARRFGPEAIDLKMLLLRFTSFTSFYLALGYNSCTI